MMEDPWGSSPWATNDAAAVENLPPPLPPTSLPNIVRLDEGSPAETSWNNDGGGVWGDWEDARDDGNSPGWGRSPALAPVEDKQVEPSWVKQDGEDDEEQPDPKSSLEGKTIADSAISLSDRLGEQDTITHDIIPSVEDATLEQTTSTITESVEEGHKGELHIRNEAPIQDDRLVEEEPGQKDLEHEAPASLEDVPPRPESRRETSTVQDLVNMDNEISRRSTSPALGPTGTPEKQSLEVTSELVSPVHDSNKATEDLVLEDGTETRDESQVSIQSDPADGPSNDSIHTTDDEEQEPPKEASKLQSGPKPSFSVDLDILDELFPETPAPAVAPEPLPDSIITDTFSSGSERKAWYLISRPGSIRKHDLGSDANDDNYVRITWGKSRIRDQTLQIVRRWMEADSIAGRVVWGRKDGAVGAHMFNWDSDAPEVGIKELLGRRKRRSEKTVSVMVEEKPKISSEESAIWRNSMPPLGKSTSTSTSTSAARHSVESLEDGQRGVEQVWVDSRMDQPLTLPSAPTNVQPKEDSLEPPAAVDDVIHPPTKAVSPSHEELNANNLEEEPRTSFQDQWHAETAQHHGDANSSVSNGNLAEDDNDDDDDEWGEMVASPTTKGFFETKADAPSGATSQIDALLSSPSADLPHEPTRAEHLPFIAVDSVPAVPASLPSPGPTPSSPMSKQPSLTNEPAQPTSSVSDKTWQAADNTTKRHSTTPGEDVQAELVAAEILRGLPDLSYMLR